MQIKTWEKDLKSENFFILKKFNKFGITESNNFVPEKRKRGRPPASVSMDKLSNKVNDETSKDKGLYLLQPLLCYISGMKTIKVSG